MSNIGIGSAPPETVLDSEPGEAIASLEAAMNLPEQHQRDAVSEMVGQWPTVLAGWVALGDRARDRVEAYSAYRVGYHRGLDRLRANGWRGSGFVRWQHPTNRGFLGALAGLAATAKDLGEDDEAERCWVFLHQLDPDWGKHKGQM